MNSSDLNLTPSVTQFREVVLWPVQLLPRHEEVQMQRHWECLMAPECASVWKEVVDEFTGDATQFGERHYKELVTFLPYVQRFLYGEGIDDNDGSGYGRSPIRVFRRDDIAQARITLPGDAGPVVFGIAHVDLYFFYDIDIAILVVEIVGENLPLRRALEVLYRFGRAYPTHWEASGRGGHCAERVEWLSRTGAVLAVSDYENKDRYLKFVCERRVPCVASHWEYLLRPLVLHHADEEGPIRYREIEYQRMPLMSFLPYSERFLQDFESRYCYDRYWEEAREHDWSDTRFICNGHAFTVIGGAAEPFLTDPVSGVLSQFRHQYFLLGLIAHFHKASLLMLSDRLGVALSRLDIRRPESVRAFKRSVRQTMEIFLRFTHRYWFESVSDQAQARDLFAMWTRHLGTQALYKQTRRRILDMIHYLDSDQLRRQADTVVRLTVVTTFGLIGTVSTGFLGMNLIAEADNPFGIKLLYFALVFIPTLALTLYTIVKSKRLSEFLEALSDERLQRQDKVNILLNVWRPKGRAARRRSSRPADFR